MPVNTERSDFVEMKEKWARIRDCFGGRDAILKAGAKYVPALPSKDAGENADYRARGNFYNALKRTVEGMVGLMFQEAAEVTFPDSLDDYLDDITLSNQPFEMFAQSAGTEVIEVGRYGILVDMPATPAVDNRPYCMGYKAESIINWKTLRIGGQDTLTLLVLKEDLEMPDPKDPFVCNVVCQYRVLQLLPTGVVVTFYQEDEKDKGKYIVTKGPIPLVRRGLPLMFIPFVFICATNATPDLEVPPLIDLADVNLGHWRNSVDYEYGLHLVALPTPWCAGSRESTQGTSEPKKMGPSVVWELELQGSAGMLEFTGEGLGSIVTAMEEKKKQMATLGARLLEESANVQETASAVKMRHSGEQASLRTVAQSMELGFTLVLQIVAWWVGVEDKPSEMDAAVELNKEYLNIKASAQDVTAGLAALQANEISFDTWWNLLRTGKWGREGITPDDEQKAIDERKAKQKKENPDPEPPPVPIKKIVRDDKGNISEIHG